MDKSKRVFNVYLMKKIAVYFIDSEKTDYPFTKDYYYGAYQYLSQRIFEEGGELYIVRGQDTYQGQGRFSRSWKFDQAGELHEAGSITVDVIYDKSRLGQPFPREEEAVVKIANTKAINEVCEDKWKTYQVFSEFCPQTFFIKSEQELKQVLAKSFREKEIFVLKPVDGDEGNGIFVVKDVTNFDFSPLQYPLLLQEFLDTSQGISNIVEGIHDLRLIYVNGTLVDAMLRAPAAGGVLCNISLGGKVWALALSKIPKEALLFGEKINESLRKIAPKSMVSIDVCQTNKGWKLIELNDKTGLPNDPKRRPFLNAVAKFLVAF